MTAKKTASRAVALATGLLLLGAAAPFGGASGIAAQAVGAGPKSDPTLERAIAEQRKVVKRQSRSIDRATALNDLANLLELQGDIAAAFEHYREAIAADGSWAPAHFNLALLAYVNGDIELAASHLETAVELDPGNAWAHYQLGRIADDSDDSAAAVEHYVRAVSLDSHLAFSDVNPHFAVNRHATEILIRADRARARALPPRAYSQPARISSLLLPAVAEKAAEPQPGEATAETAEAAETADAVDPEDDRSRRVSRVALPAASAEEALGTPRANITGVTYRAPGETETAAADSPEPKANEDSRRRSRVFTRDDLRTRTFAAGSVAGAPAGGFSSARPGAGRRNEVQPGTPIGPGGRQPQSSGSPGNFGTPRGGRFQPSVRSSAQLETTIRRSTVPAP